MRRIDRHRHRRLGVEQLAVVLRIQLRRLGIEDFAIGAADDIDRADAGHALCRAVPDFEDAAGFGAVGADSLAEHADRQIFDQRVQELLAALQRQGSRFLFGDVGYETVPEDAAVGFTFGQGVAEQPVHRTVSMSHTVFTLPWRQVCRGRID